MNIFGIDIRVRRVKFDRLVEVVERILKRRPRWCAVTWSRYTDNATCLDVAKHAIDNPDKYFPSFQKRLASGEEFCDYCLLRDALGHEAKKVDMQ